MADIKWIKIVTDIFDDEKILLIETLPEADSIIVIWFKLLCLAGKQNNSGVFMINDKMPYSDKMLSTIFRRKESTVQLALSTFEQFGMIEVIDDVITIPQWGKHQNFDKIEKNNEYQKNYMREYREKQKMLACKPNSKPNCNTNSNINSETNCNTNVRALEKNRIEKNRIEKIKSVEIENFFESVWKLYPNKVGKGSVNSKTKKELFDLGYDTVSKCIERYVSKKEDWKKWQNGSTFFNSGYIDYLDENYLSNVEVVKSGSNEKQESKSRFDSLTEEEKKYYFDKSAFVIDGDGESVDYSKLTEKERIYLQKKGVI